MEEATIADPPAANRTFVIGLGEPPVAGHVGHEDQRKATLNALLGNRPGAPDPACSKAGFVAAENGVHRRQMSL